MPQGDGVPSSAVPTDNHEFRKLVDTEVTQPALRRGDGTLRACRGYLATGGLMPLRSSKGFLTTFGHRNELA